jgi:stage III sporulation protein AH
MNKEEFGEMIKDFFAKLGKRNLIIICSVLLVGVIAVASWALFPADKGDDLPSGADGEGEGTQDVGAQQEDSYFAASQLSRQKARDEAMEVLQSVVENEGAVESVKTQALADLSKMAMAIEQEANIETLIMAKGFEKCVAVISGDTARIIVSGTGLTPAQIAQINEIVYEEANISPVNITITEKA